MDSRVYVVALAAAVGCGSEADGDEAWEPGTAGGTADDGDSGGSSSTGAASGGGESDTGVGGSESSGGPTVDCSPAWAATWIGSPCFSDGDCAYEGGLCLLEADGFPCGTCSAPCDMLCPDLEGTPATFCIDGAAVGIAATGHCLSQCDPGLLGGDGCRDGYGCSALERYMDPATTAAVCVPNELVGEAETECQEMLLELGAVFAPTTHTPESPAGFPALVCDLEDPVLLYGPINGVGLRYTSDNGDAPVRIACEAAVSIVGSAAVAQSLGADEIIHLGTYNCRVIGDGPNLSTHGLGLAIDVEGFTLGDGTEVTVLADWEVGNPSPVTPFGQLLRDFTDQIWAMGLWNIILTPEFNAAHYNHFHLDLTPGGNTYE